MSGTTRVLVVVPTLNEAPHIEPLLLGLLAEDHEPLQLRIVVADGGSTDGTVEIVRRFAHRWPNLLLIDNPERIQSAGINLAVRHFGADADVLVRCDAHSEYPLDYCARLVRTLARTGAASVVVPLDSVGRRPFQRALAWLSNSPLGTGGSAHRAGKRSGFVDHGHHAAFRMSAFRAAGGYDARFSHNEDAELDCRQRLLGARIYLDADTRVGYVPRASLGALYAQYFKYGAGRSRTVRRHPRSLRLRQLLVPAHLAFGAFALVVSPWFAWLLLWPLVYLALVAAFSLRLLLAQREASALLAFPAAVTMHTAWALGFFFGFFKHRESVWSREMIVPLRLRTATGGGA